MLYTNKKTSVILNDNCVFWTAIHTIIGLFTLYYCVLALIAIVSMPRYKIDECSTSLLYMFVCMSIVISIGTVVSHIYYRYKKTNKSLAIFAWFVISIIGLYGLILIEMSDACHLKHKNDLYDISWVWINIVSFGILLVFCIMTYYLIVGISVYPAETVCSTERTKKEKTCCEHMLIYDIDETHEL